MEIPFENSRNEKNGLVSIQLISKGRVTFVKGTSTPPLLPHTQNGREN